MKKSITHLDKEIYYYAREDISFVIKYVYSKKVIFQGRRGSSKYLDYYNNSIVCIKIPRYRVPQKVKNNGRYHLVLFEIPDGFPKYKPFK